MVTLWIACLLIMMGHYLGLYKYAQSFTPSIRIIDIINNSLLSFWIDEGYWLYMFFVVSGYLVSKSKITSIGDLISKSIGRFLRLALPILFSYLVIYVIYLTLGFHTVETNTLFQCAWYQGYYTGEYTIYDVLLAPIYVILYGSSLLNGPYWCLRMMFISSLSYIVSFGFVIILTFLFATCFYFTLERFSSFFTRKVTRRLLQLMNGISRTNA